MSEFYRGNGEVIKNRDTADEAPKNTDLNSAYRDDIQQQYSYENIRSAQAQRKQPTRGVTFDEPEETIKVVVDDGTTCHACGNKLNPGDLFCRKCGAKVSPAAQSAEQRTYSSQGYTRHGYARQRYRETSRGLVPHGYKNKYVSFFLCLFLGVLGVHHFYEGSIGLGLAWLFTGGIFGVGWIVDLIIRFVRLFDKDDYFLP
ncbi:MAG: TM2 domain-containing protein [Oscillospiraceae bacterium]|nr:TM2 domain-containing protein [Oscillospiraceae bacterium]